jgi:hypothetical protein
MSLQVDLPNKNSSRPLINFVFTLNLTFSTWNHTLIVIEVKVHAHKLTSIYINNDKIIAKVSEKFQTVILDKRLKYKQINNIPGMIWKILSIGSKSYGKAPHVLK